MLFSSEVCSTNFTDMEHLTKIIKECESLAFDLNFKEAKKWKSEGADRVLVGYLPIYVPREIIHAVNGLGVGIMGAGDRKQIIKGDAYYQSDRKSTRLNSS